MPHPRRSFVPGFSAHIYQRAINSAHVFSDEEDFAAFLELLRARTSDEGVAVHGFAIMHTHYHLLATPLSLEALPRAMKRIHGGYVRHFNRKHERFGTIWGGRYKAKTIGDERYWLTALRYIEQNPVAAGIVRNAGEYKWSSYSWHAAGTGPDWVVSHTVYDALGSTPIERQEKYRLMDAAGVPLDFEVT